MLDYDVWLIDTEERINTECAESGADREVGFSIEDVLEAAYCAEVL